MILTVFVTIGMRLSIADAYSQLITHYAGQAYAKQKAAGSLGGSVHNGIIALRKGYYIRLR